jgi:hypothetical protein
MYVQVFQAYYEETILKDVPASNMCVPLYAILFTL